MGLSGWPIVLVLWVAGGLVVFFTRQGISRDNRISAAIAALFFLIGLAILLDSPIALAFLICVPLGAGMVWAGILPILDAINYNIKVEKAIYRGSTPEIEIRDKGKQVLTFSYTIDNARLTGTTVDTFTPGQIDRKFEINKPASIWVNKKDLSSCKVNRYENLALAPIAIVVGLIFVAIPFMRLFS